MRVTETGRWAALALVVTSFCGGAAAQTGEGTAHWRRTGEAALQSARQRGPLGKKAWNDRARNLILFVGDGMGVATVTAARILAGQSGEVPAPGEESLLSFERFPNLALSKTYSVSQQVSDSASTMTALVTGVKTNDGVLSIGPEVDLCATDAEEIARHTLSTLLEYAEDQGFATGIVTTTRVTHATPAALYAHTTNREWESDRTIPPGLRDIARQLVEFERGDGIEVVLGGGRENFYCESEDALVKGARKGGCAEFKKWRERTGVRYVQTREELQRVRPGPDVRLVGLFNDGHMEYEVDRRAKGLEPSLTEMTAKAIEILRHDPDGYFLMVEAGRIDHGHHAGNAYRALTETIELSNAVERAVELAGEQTLIVVTADHSHVFHIGGYPRRGNPILGRVVESGAQDSEFATDLLGLPYTTLGYANGPGYPGGSWTWEFPDERDECAGLEPGGTGRKSELQPEGSKVFPHQPHGVRPGTRPDLRAIDTGHPNFLQESAVPLTGETHGGEDVAIYAAGPMAHLVRGVMEQHALFYVMREALGLRATVSAARSGKAE